MNTADLGTILVQYFFHITFPIHFSIPSEGKPARSVIPVAMHWNPHGPVIGGIILAAGTSSRLGRPKQLLKLGDKPVFRYAVDCALRNQLSPLVIVTGSQREAMARHLYQIHAELKVNPDYLSGMASSLRVGIQELRNRVDAAVVFLSDQPLIPDLVVRDLVTTYIHNRNHGCRIVRPRYAGLAANPVLFDAALFEELENLSGDTGARELIKTHQSDLRQLDYDDASWGLDIDTEEDWQQVQKLYASLKPRLPED